MYWTKEEKHDVFHHEQDYPELARLLKARNKYEFENNKG